MDEASAIVHARIIAAVNGDSRFPLNGVTGWEDYDLHRIMTPGHRVGMATQVQIDRWELDIMGVP